MPWKHKQEMAQQYHNIHGNHKPCAAPSTLGPLWVCPVLPHGSCLFLNIVRKEGTINNLLGPSVSRSAWGHRKDTLQEGVWGCSQWHHPRNSVPFKEHQCQASATYILEGQTSRRYNKEPFSCWEFMIWNPHLNPCWYLSLWKGRAESARSDIKSLLCHLVVRWHWPSYLTTLSLSSFLFELGLIIIPTAYDWMI